MPANQSTPEVTRADQCTHKINDPDLAFIAAARDFHNAGPDAFTPGYDHYGDLLDVVERIATRTPARGGDELREAARRAHDTPIELNPNNYSHDDVCEANDAAVEAILLLADALGETHGKTPEWWSARRAALASTDMAGAGERSSRKLNDWISAALDGPPVEGLTSGEGAVTPAMIDAAKRYVRGEDDAIGWAIEAALSAAPKATATASVREMPTPETLSRAIDPGAWEDELPGMTRAAVTGFHLRRQQANAAAARVLATLTDSGTTATIGGERA